MKHVGVLLDFDLASMGASQSPTSNHRTGTLPFMSREILWYANRTHQLHHDLESYVYCLIWHAVGYRRGKPYPRPKQGRKFDGKIRDDYLKSWRVGDFEQMGSQKSRIFTDILFREDLLRIISDNHLNNTCRTLLRPYQFALSNIANVARGSGGDGVEAVRTSVFKPIGAAVTYTLLMNALNRSDLACEESCCISAAPGSSL